MIRKPIVAVLFVFVLVPGLVQAAEPLKSGPQKGEDLPGPFHPLNVTGDNAGEKACLFCKYGDSPVAMIFARSATPELAKLIKKIDDCAVKNKSADMGCCVIFCSDDGALRTKLEELAKKDRLKEAVLAIDNPAGPKEYNIVQDAAVTVLLYTDRTVRANFAFRKGELNDKTIEQVLAAIPQILPKK